MATSKKADKPNSAALSGQNDQGGVVAGSASSEPQMLVRRTAVMEEYEGPIPRASELKAYDEILPGAADRILSMAEQQASHRQSIEKSAIKSNIENSRRGQLFAFIISMSAIIAGFILIMLNKDGMGIAVILTDLVALITVFAGNRVSELRELAQKRKIDKQTEK